MAGAAAQGQAQLAPSFLSQLDSLSRTRASICTTALQHKIK
jgi:hypothetical protein